MHNDTPSPSINEEDEEDIFLDDDIEIINFNSEDEQQIEEGASAQIVDDSRLVFEKHTAAVFTCALDPISAANCITGGEDDVAYVWDTSTGNILLECLGHKDSVIAVGFNHDATLVASADMSGVINVWKVQTGEKMWNFEISELRWLEWHSKTNVLVAGSGEGETWMWRIPSGDCKIFQSFSASNECGKIMLDGIRTAVGYGDGSVRVWDLKAASVLSSVVDNNAHSDSVTTLDCNHDNTLILTGSTDATAKIINSTNGRVLATLQCGEIGGDDAVESVAFNANQPLAVTGTLKGAISIWDIPTQIQRQNCQQNIGISKLLWDSRSCLVYTAGLDGIVRLYDGRSGNIERSWEGHKTEILDIALSKEGDYFVTTSEDSNCRIFYTC